MTETADAAMAENKPRRRRVAITGISAISSCGIGKDVFFDGLNSPAPMGPRRVKDFDPLKWLDPKEAKRTDRFAQFSIAAADMALEDCGRLEVPKDRIGVIFATGIGGLATLQEQITNLSTKGPRRVSPFLVPMMMCNAGAAGISMRHGFSGPCQTIVTACASSNHAISDAYRQIAFGFADAVITGGAEAAIEPVGETPAIGEVAFTQMTALSSTGISRPFDQDRDGFVIAEGAAALILEEMSYALARGAHIYGEILGTAANADAYHITAPSPSGEGARLCMELAIKDAGLTPEDITHINAHGTSTPLNDLAEAQAIAKLFSFSSPPVTSLKGVLGHSLGAAGALEAVAVAMTIEKGIIPPTAGLMTKDAEIEISLVQDKALAFTPGPVLSNSFGFGGHNGCLIIGPYSI